jgi:hypothetical protein
MSGSLLRKFGRGLALVGLELRVRLFGKDLKSTTTAPTDGQVLRYVAADDAWSPGTVSGGSLPAGALGSVLVHDGLAWVSLGVGTAGQVMRVVSGEPKWATLAAGDVGAIPTPGTPISGGLLYYAGSWQSTAAGSLRQPMLSGGGAIAPAWGADVVPLTQRVIDGLGTSVTVCATLAHDLNAGGGGDGIGARCELQARNSASTLVAAAAIDGVLTTATAGSEVGAYDVYVRSGGALVRYARWSPAGNVLGVSTVVAQYQGGARVPERTVSTSTTLDAQDEVVFVDATSGAVTLTLPAGASGRVLAIQRIAGSNSVVIQRAGSDTIREGSTGGLTSWTISDDARHGLIYRSGGTEWVAEV